MKIRVCRDAYPFLIDEIKGEKEMQKYDLVFYRGNGPVSKLIQKVTKSEFSHVALVLDSFHLVETDWKYPLAIRHISYKFDDCVVMRYPGLTEEQGKKIERYLEDTINSRYDYALVVSHFFNVLWKSKLINDPARFDCSEWIDRAFHYAGIDLCPWEEFGSVTPADLSNSPLLNVVEAIDR